MRGDLERVLFDQSAIHRRLDDIAAQISSDHRQRELTVIAVLHGSLMFVADLLRRIPLPLKLECLSVASYHGEAQTSGEVAFKLTTASPSGGGPDAQKSSPAKKEKTQLKTGMFHSGLRHEPPSAWRSDS